MTQYLALNQGDAIKLDGTTLPGVVTGIDVSAEFDVERKRLEGKSFRAALLKGYKDAEVIITLEVLPPDEIAQIKQLEAAFKINYAQAKVTPQRVVNPLLDARGVTAVLFKRLVTRQTNDDEALLCELTFAEFEPLIGKLEGKSRLAIKEGQQALPSGQSGGGGAADGVSSTPSQAQGGLGRGSSDATTVLNIIPNTLGLPSNAPPFLNDISSGGPAAGSFIGGGQ